MIEQMQFNAEATPEMFGAFMENELATIFLTAAAKRKQRNSGSAPESGSTFSVWLAD